MEKTRDKDERKSGSEDGFTKLFDFSGSRGGINARERMAVKGD